MGEAQVLQWEQVQKMAPPAAGKRIAYGSGPDQFGDLRLPAGRGPFPVAVLIHGGCWRQSINLDNIAHLAASLARDGIATWSIEYRRADGPGGGWPGTFDDVLAGIDYLKKIDGLDLNHVALVGHSAGGQLALWAGAKRKDVVRGVVSLSGVPDLRGAEQTVCTGMIPLLARGTAGDWAKISPIEMLPLGVPQWVLAAEYDDIVPWKWGRQYAEAAKRKGDHVELVELFGAGHFEWIVPSSSAYSHVLGAVRSAAGK